MEVFLYVYFLRLLIVINLKKVSSNVLIAFSSCKLTPCWRAEKVSARYMAPVSMYKKESFSATNLATVLFPAPAGPSIAMRLA